MTDFIRIGASYIAVDELVSVSLARDENGRPENGWVMVRLKGGREFMEEELWHVIATGFDNLKTARLMAE